MKERKIENFDDDSIVKDYYSKPKMIDEVVVGLKWNFWMLEEIPKLMLVSFLRRGERDSFLIVL